MRCVGCWACVKTKRDEELEAYVGKIVGQVMADVGRPERVVLYMACMGRPCRVDWTIEVPAHILLEIKSPAFAEVRLLGVTGRVRIEASFLNLVSRAPLSGLQVRTGDFDAYVRDLAGDASFSFDGGLLRMTYTRPVRVTRKINGLNAGVIVNVPRQSSIDLSQFNKGRKYAFKKIVEFTPQREGPGFYFEGWTMGVSLKVRPLNFKSGDNVKEEVAIENSLAPCNLTNQHSMLICKIAGGQDSRDVQGCHEMFCTPHPVFLGSRSCFKCWTCNTRKDKASKRSLELSISRV